MIFRLPAANASWTVAALAVVGATRSPPTVAPTSAQISASAPRKLVATGPVMYLHWHTKLHFFMAFFYRFRGGL